MKSSVYFIHCSTKINAVLLHRYSLFDKGSPSRNLLKRREETKEIELRYLDKTSFSF